MKTTASIDRLVISSLLVILLLSVLGTACQKDPEVVPVTECTASEIQKPISSTAPHYNLNVFLKGTSATACGYVEFRQEVDGAQFIHLDTWVHGLEPGTAYSLQRAVDTTLDGNCTSTTWLTLGKGLTAENITTDANGSGYAELFRSVSMIAVGTTFDIHFQIIKVSDSSVVLTGDCYQYTVR